MAAKDPKPLAARTHEDLVEFDVLPPLRSRGGAALVKRAREWFDSYSSDIGYDVHELEIAADGHVAFCSFVYRVTGTLKTGDAVDMWVRATLGCRRIDGQWCLVHEHESVPFDPQTGQAVLDLAPSDVERSD